MISPGPCTRTATIVLAQWSTLLRHGRAQGQINSAIEAAPRQSSCFIGTFVPCPIFVLQCTSRAARLTSLTRASRCNLDTQGEITIHQRWRWRWLWWRKGCEGCAQWYSGRVDECMDCGKNCAALCPQGGAECYKGEHFVACHKSCMQGPPHAGEEPIECEKYQSWGTHAYKGCGGCTRDYPGRVDDCMGCGKQCAEMCAPGDEECYKGEKFGSCHKTCMLKQDPTGHNETGDCGKYRSLGNEAVKGCEGCAFWYPRRVGECMSCGGQCAHFCPQGGDECYHGEKFVSCHKTCMFKAAPKPDKKQELVDKNDCYFDEECSKQVDWNKIGALKRSIFERLKVMRQTQNPTGVKDLMELAHTAFAQAGMPENRIDYTLTKWVDSVYPEAFEEKLDRNALQERTPSVELIV